MKRYMWQRIVFALVLLAPGCADRHKSYMRHPLIREMNISASAAADTEVSTQVEPYPPPRPALPSDPSHIAVLPQ